MQLAGLDTMVFIYLFAFLTGLAATMAEPALIAVGEQAEEAARGRLRASHVRLAAALGIACGITLGAQRIVSGGDFHLYFIGIFAVLICFTLLAPKYIVALSYDVGGAGSTAINVPLLTALGMGLASQIEGRSTLIDGFGLIAFATMLPVAITTTITTIMTIMTMTIMTMTMTITTAPRRSRSASSSGEPTFAARSISAAACSRS